MLAGYINCMFVPTESLKFAAIYPFGTVFLLILLCIGLHVSCLTGYILWGAFLNVSNNLFICFH
jgi:hypothetical protein